MALLLLFSYTLVLATVVASVPSHSSSSFAGLHRIQHHRHSTTSNIQQQQQQQQQQHHHNTYIHKILQVRGGGGNDDEYDSDEEKVEEEPIVTKTKRLSSSTKQKVQRAKSAQVKSKVKVAMMSSSSSSAKKSSASAGKQNNRSLYKRFVPYIIRACINPFTLLAMTKSYFVSLCDINYLKEVSCCSLSLLSVAGVGRTSGAPRFMYIYTTSFVN